jgi:hypothetical protein
MCAHSEGGHMGQPPQEINYLFDRSLMLRVMGQANLKAERTWPLRQVSPDGCMAFPACVNAR